METVIKALSAMPGVSWSLHGTHMTSGMLYSGDVSTSTGNIPGEIVSRTYHTKHQADPHDVLVELLGAALKWQEQGESQA